VRPLKAASEKHAKGLVSEPSLEWISDKVVAIAARKGLDEEFVDPGEDRAQLLDSEPLGNLGRQYFPFLFVGEHGPNAACEIGRQRKLAAGIEGNFGRVVGGTDRNDFVFVNSFETEDQSGEEERVADGQSLDEVLLDLAKHSTAAAGEASAAAAR